MTLDLHILPKRRAERVREVYQRELAAERIAALYPEERDRTNSEQALYEIADRLKAEGLAFVTPRFVRAVVREGR